ncbi:MAG: DUF2249 domain-containing protein [Halobacteria archaeon]|nr:DUF2249 domain-containing protein [Halobacteria archaeon]
MPNENEIDLDEVARKTGAPDGNYRLLDVRELPPPEPLKKALETLAELEAESEDDAEVLIQLTDRVPQHLYPKVEDRGYAYETVDEVESAAETEAVATVIWKEGATEGQ